MNHTTRHLMPATFALAALCVGFQLMSVPVAAPVVADTPVVTMPLVMVTAKREVMLAQALKVVELPRVEITGRRDAAAAELQLAQQARELANKPG